MNTFINTDYRTYIIGFTNTNQKLIFQDEQGLKQAIEQGRKQGNEATTIDADTLKELNVYGRFVIAKNVPTWLYSLLAADMKRNAERLKQQLTSN